MPTNARCDLGTHRIAAGIVVAIEVEPHAIIAISGNDVQFPVGDQIVALTGEIVLGDVRNTIGLARVDDCTSDPLRGVHRRRSDIRRQVWQPLGVTAWNDDDVVAIDRPLADDCLYERVGKDRHGRIIEFAEGAR